MVSNNNEINKLYIRASAGVVENENGEILVCKRIGNKHLANKLEFPGGKIEDNETILEALKRELFEEVNVQIITNNDNDIKLIEKIVWDFGTRECTIYFYKIEKEQWKGEVIGKELQPIQWVKKEELKNMIDEFPEPNKIIINHLLKNK